MLKGSGNIRILLASLLGLGALGSFFYFVSRDSGDSSEVAAQESEPEGFAQDSAALTGGEEAVSAEKSNRLQKNSVQKQSPSKNLSSPSVENLAELQEKAPVSDCLKADLESQTSELKGTLHEFQLPRKFAKNESLCVFVEGKSVDFSRVSDERVRIDWKIAKANTKVSASYCAQGRKCKVSCPAPEKDFWATIGDADAVPAGEGFAGVETAQEKELQKELKALKDVLNRKPAQAKVAVWKVSKVTEVSCASQK